ncbi:hypothetical protein RN001_009748 [Aquatica leii]|uniref:Ionotropic receptor 21a n=1 Tax=Aquatica leii TaxID=1421715 RepID=A0AAN7P5M6_9COLE|nr:hypothetical protein RN001_009748 [Aquatica leii]
MKLLKIITLILITSTLVIGLKLQKRALEKSHEKPQSEKWADAFLGKRTVFDHTMSLVNLLVMISDYLDGCTPVFLYDVTVEAALLEELLKHLTTPFMHGKITRNVVKDKKMLYSLDNKCVSYVLFLKDVMKCRDIIGAQNYNKVIIIARSSQWKVYEFLATDIAQSFVNLLVIAKSEKIVSSEEELPFILYTHKLYVDGLGSSIPHVITSWMNGSLTRPKVQLFPEKMKSGFAGHRFIISVANQPPFTIKRGRDLNDDIQWEGIEVRLVKLLAEIYNFTTDFREAGNVDQLGSGRAVTLELQNKKADIGIGGLYIVSERVGKVDISFAHSQDCAAFISLTSTALPRWRAIMGPFQWTVWLTLTLTYLLAIFPLVFSDRHSLRYLLDTPEEMENMFWYVFGTFTNCFSFVGKKSWSKSDKMATRLLIGFYWLFTIIITACYTGSIIAFVTLPVFPDTVDTVKQLLSGRYQIGTLDKGGWEYWFENSSDPYTKQLLRRVEYVPNIESGIKNTTSAFFWSYAFLGSRAQLDYLVRTNFTTSSKRSILHISSECFVPYGVAVTFSLKSVYGSIFNVGIQRSLESGLVKKIGNDVQWEMMRSATGKLLQANVGNTRKVLEAEDRALALDDTQGMFLLLSFGYLMGGISLLSEWLGGFLNLCKRKMRRFSTADTLSSNPRIYDIPTPRQKLDSIQYSRSSRFFESFDEESGDREEENIKNIEVEINNIAHLNDIFGEENVITSDKQEELREDIITNSSKTSIS